MTHLNFEEDIACVQLCIRRVILLKTAWATKLMFIQKNEDFNNYEDDGKDDRGKRRKKMILNHRQWTKIANDDDDDGP